MAEKSLGELKSMCIEVSPDRDILLPTLLLWPLTPGQV